MREKWPLIELKSEYQGSKKPIDFICDDPNCPKTGERQNQEAGKLKTRGCKSCGNKRGHEKRKKTDDDFKKDLRKRNAKPDVQFPLEPCEPYRGATTEIEFVCKVCGRHSTKKPQRVRGDRPNCTFCQAEYNHKQYRKNIDDFRAQLEERGIEHRVAEDAEYKNDHAPIHMICGNCGSDWWPSPGNVLNNKGYCPTCKPSKKPSDEEAKRQIYTKREKLGYPPVLCLGGYEGDDKPILTKCETCGHQWKPTPSNLKRGKSCPQCSASQKTSFFERWAGEMLRAVLGEENVRLRSKEAIGKELDIFIPEKKIALEPGHWYYHHRPHILSTDQEKQRLCQEAHIKLLQIYVGYSEESPPTEKGIIVPRDKQLEETQVEQMLSYDSICYQNTEIKDSQIMQLVAALLRKGFQKAMQPDDPLWEQTKMRAHGKILINDDASIDELRREITNPDIEVLGAIKVWDNGRYHTKYRYRCKRHPNFEDTTTKQTLAKYAKKLSRCPKCEGCRIEKKALSASS